MRARRLTRLRGSRSRVRRFAVVVLHLVLLVACNGILGIGEPVDPPDEGAGRGGNAGAQGEHGGESGDGRGGSSGSLPGGSGGSGASGGTSSGASGEGTGGENAGNGGVAGEDAGNGGVAGEDAGSGGVAGEDAGNGGGAGSAGVGGAGGTGTVSFTPFSNATVMPTGAGLRGITAAPDGNLYFTMFEANGVGRITTEGDISLVATIDPRESRPSSPIGIVAGPDGNLWFAENHSNRIGCVNPVTGVVKHLDLPMGRAPYAIAVGSDGNLWFTGHRDHTVGRLVPLCDNLTPDLLTEFTTPTSGSFPWGIASDDLGRIWFTEEFGDKLGWLSAGGTGTIMEIELPSGSGPTAITVAAGGAIWFSESIVSMVGRLLPGGQPQHFELGGSIDPIGITSDPSGNVWIACDDDVVQMSPEGVVMRRVSTGADSGNYWITSGPDGNLWITSARLNRIGRISL